MPRKSSASRRSRIRRIGFLSLLLTTLLTPAGIIVSTVTAAALIGGAFHLSRATPEAPATPSHRASVKPGSPQYLSIERDGKPMTLVMAEDENGYGGGMDSLDPANPLFAGLAGDGPARHGTAREGMPGTPGGGFAPGGDSMPGGTAPNPPSLDGPPDSDQAPGGGSSPSGLPAGEPPSGGPSDPPGTGGPHRPTGDVEADEPRSETDDPTKPEKKPPPVILDLPPRVDPPPTKGQPEEILPGFDTSPQAGNPLGPQTPPPGKQRLTQPNAVPEPSMLGLMLLGVIAMAWAGRRRPGPLRPA
ncbi:MAG: PEP-CTERM sorting domain-containing protein [Thiobacillus sp.]|nr:PEP-CTERM sorting domain-containing protein [Thiobacillus sp.]